MGTESGSLDTMGRIRSGRFLDTMGTKSGRYLGTMSTKSGRYLGTMGTRSGRYLGTMGTRSGRYLDTMGTRSGRFLNTMGTKSGRYLGTMSNKSGRYLGTMGTRSGRYLGTMGTVVNRCCHFSAYVSLIITLRISFSAWVVAESGREGKTTPVIATRGNGLRFFKFLYEWIVPNICLHKSYHKILSVKSPKCWRVNLPASHWLN